MTYLDRYLIRSLATPMFLAFAVTGFLGSSINLGGSSFRLLSKGLTPWDLALMGLCTLPITLPSILPAVLLFGLLAGFGKLAERKEIIAMHAAGVPPRRVLALAILLAFGLAFLCIAIQQWVQPALVGRAAQLVTRDLPRRATVNTFQPGVVHQVDDWRIYFERSDRRLGEIYGVDIVQFESGQAPAVFHAVSARVEADAVGQSLILGPGFTVMPDGYRFSTEGMVLTIPYETISSSIVGDRMALSSTDLLKRERELSARHDASGAMKDAISLRKLRREITDRMGLPFAAVGFAIIGVALVARQNRDRHAARQRLFGIAAVPVLAYHLAALAIQPQSLTPLAIDMAAIWTLNLVMVLIGIALYWRMSKAR